MSSRQMRKVVLTKFSAVFLAVSLLTLAFLRDYEMRISLNCIHISFFKHVTIMEKRVHALARCNITFHGQRDSFASDKIRPPVVTRLLFISLFQTLVIDIAKQFLRNSISNNFPLWTTQKQKEKICVFKFYFTVKNATNCRFWMELN